MGRPDETPRVERIGGLAPYLQGVALELQIGETAGLMSSPHKGGTEVDIWQITRLSKDTAEVTKIHEKP
jgi:hypothetical protein